MNARQALKITAQKLENAERIMFLNKTDIQAYNACIADMIAGKSPCPYCHDYEECKLKAKDKKGCSEWILKIPKFTSEEVKQEVENADEKLSEGLHVVSSEG